MLKLSKLRFASILLGVVCGMLTGCGTKGPLYIPEQRYPQQAFEQTHKLSLAKVSQLVVIQNPSVINSN